MLYVIVAGGPLPEQAAALIGSLANSEEKTFLISCDSGTDFLARHNIIPDLAVGDMDSISSEGLEFIKVHDIKTEKYPVEKDWTDTEAALKKVEDEAILVCPVEGRIDHVLSNIGLVLKMKSEGKDIAMTDGITCCYPLCGEDSVNVDLSPYKEPVAASLVPCDISNPVKGVTTDGLYYALDDLDLTACSSFSFSSLSAFFSASVSEYGL